MRVVISGGNLNNGGNDGVAARNSNNDLSNANSNNVSQLSYFNLTNNLGPCQNRTINSIVLVAPAKTQL